MTKPDPVNYRLLCRDCGLEAPIPHASLRECVEALQLESSRLSEHLRRGQLGDSVTLQSISDAGDSVMGPRLTLMAERSPDLARAAAGELRPRGPDLDQRPPERRRRE